MRSFQDRLIDILEAIGRIEAERAKGKAVFDSDCLLQVWMVHHLMIIGEAVRSIDPATKQKYPSVSWRQIAGMRNVLVHDYFRINHEIVWTTVENDIPRLKEQLQQILQQFVSGRKFCALCNNKVATFHLTQNVRGQVAGKIMIRKIDLCEECARQSADQVTGGLPDAVWALAAPEYIDDADGR